jgi:O-antigen/teichoic acid export membrane protein
MMEQSRVAREKSHATKTLVGALWILGSGITSTLLKFGVIVVLARLLTPAEFGLIAATAAIVQLLQALSYLGIGPALIQRLELTRAHVATGQTISVATGLVLGGGVVLAAPLVADAFREPEVTQPLRYMSLILVVSGHAVVPQALLQRDMRFGILAISEAASFLIGYGLVSVVGAALGFGIWALVAAMVAQASLGMLMLLIAQPPVRPAFDTRSARDLLRFGVSLSASSAIHHGIKQIDTLVIMRSLDAVALGLYSRVGSVTFQPINQLSNSLSSVLFPAMAKVQNDLERFNNGYCRSLGIFLLGLTSFGAATSVLAPEVIAVALGSQWLAAIPIMQVIALGMSIRGTTRLIGAAFRARGRANLLLVLQLEFLCVTLAACLGGIQFGLFGIAAGISLAVLVHFVVASVLVTVALKCPGRRVAAIVVRCFLIAGVSAAAAAGLAFMLRDWHAPDMLILVFGYAVAGGTLLLMLAFTPRWLLGDDIVWAYQFFIEKSLEHRMAVRLRTQLTLARTSETP